MARGLDLASTLHCLIDEATRCDLVRQSVEWGHLEGLVLPDEESGGVEDGGLQDLLVREHAPRQLTQQNIHKSNRRHEATCQLTQPTTMKQGGTRRGERIIKLTVFAFMYQGVEWIKLIES